MGIYTTLFEVQETGMEQIKLFLKRLLIVDVRKLSAVSALAAVLSAGTINATPLYPAVSASPGGFGSTGDGVATLSQSTTTPGTVQVSRTSEPGAGTGDNAGGPVGRAGGQGRPAGGGIGGGNPFHEPSENEAGGAGGGASGLGGISYGGSVTTKEIGRAGASAGGTTRVTGTGGGGPGENGGPKISTGAAGDLGGFSHGSPFTTQQGGGAGSSGGATVNGGGDAPGFATVENFSLNVIDQIFGLDGDGAIGAQGPSGRGTGAAGGGDRVAVDDTRSFSQPAAIDVLAGLLTNDPDSGGTMGIGRVIATLQSSYTIPAPSTLALLGLGLVGFGWSRRKNV